MMTSQLKETFNSSPKSCKRRNQGMKSFCRWFSKHTPLHIKGFCLNHEILQFLPSSGILCFEEALGGMKESVFFHKGYRLFVLNVSYPCVLPSCMQLEQEIDLNLERHDVMKVASHEWFEKLLAPAIMQYGDSCSEKRLHHFKPTIHDATLLQLCCTQHVACNIFLHHFLQYQCNMLHGTLCTLTQNGRYICLCGCLWSFDCFIDEEIS